MQLEDGPGPESPPRGHDANVHYPYGFSRFTSFNVYHLNLVCYEPHFTDEAAEAPRD